MRVDIPTRSGRFIRDEGGLTIYYAGGTRSVTLPNEDWRIIGPKLITPEEWALFGEPRNEQAVGETPVAETNAAEAQIGQTQWVVVILPRDDDNGRTTVVRLRLDHDANGDRVTREDEATLSNMPFEDYGAIFRLLFPGVPIIDLGRHGEEFNQVLEGIKHGVR